MTEAERKEFRAELERVLHSEAIRHSDGLRRLLSYLGEKFLAGETGDLKEYTIGLEAFHKPPDYDPQQDPAVRVLASKLRRRLEEYYLKEGAGHDVRIELPRGHYELRFGRRSEGAPPLRVAALGAEVKKWRRVSLGLGVCMVLMLAGGVYWYLQGPPGPGVSGAEPRWTPELELIWQPFLESDRPVLISMGTPLFTKFSGAFFRSPKINELETAVGSEQIEGLRRHLGSSYALPWYGFTGVGEATGAFLLSRLLHGRKPDLYLQRSSALKWDDIRRSDVIFLGSPKFNVQLKNLPIEWEFVIEGGSIINLRPRPGEQQMYGDRWGVTKDILLEDYALVSRLPGLHGHGEIMVLASSASEGTWAAVEYVTQPGYARDLVQRLRQPDGTVPKAFQVLVRARFQDHVPTEVSYVTHRVLEGERAEAPKPRP